MVTATRGRVTVPVNPPKWSPPPRAVAPSAIGDCPACERRVTRLVGSPTRRPHLVMAVECGCWLTVDEANDLENGAWQ